MVCSKCGAQISDTAKFCEECGTPITPVTDSISIEDQKLADGNADPTVNVDLPASNTKPTHKKGNLGKIIIALISLVAVGIVALKTYSSDSNKYKRVVNAEFKQAVQSINEENEYVSDLSCTVSFEKIVGSFGMGDISFRSNQTDKYDPETMYKIMGDISESVASVDLGEFSFSVSGHSDRFCDWFCNGHKYELDARGLRKDGTFIWEDAEKIAEIEALEEAYNNSTDSPSYRTVSDDEEEFWYAVTAAQDLVKDELKSPSSAKFSYSASDYSVQRSGDYWLIGGYVDAENGFGATIRKEWIATFAMGDISGSQYKISDYAVLFL